MSGAKATHNSDGCGVGAAHSSDDSVAVELSICLSVAVFQSGVVARLLQWVLLLLVCLSQQLVLWRIVSVSAYCLSLFGAGNKEHVHLISCHVPLTPRSFLGRLILRLC